MDWQGLITRKFNSDPCDGAEMKFGAPATDEELAQVERQFGFSLPDEFRSLYSAYNGYGVVFDNKPDEIYWEFRPLQDLERFISECRDWIASTHSSVSLRFFPFYDSSTGDSAGYLLDENSMLLSGIYDFHHERYDFDEAQDYNEFIVPAAETIASYLDNVIAECENNAG